jgi:hypothetical protein
VSDRSDWFRSRDRERQSLELETPASLKMNWSCPLRFAVSGRAREAGLGDEIRTSGVLLRRKMNARVRRLYRDWLRHGGSSALKRRKTDSIET